MSQAIFIYEISGETLVMNYASRDDSKRRDGSSVYDFLHAQSSVFCEERGLGMKRAVVCKVTNLPALVKAAKSRKIAVLGKVR